MPRFTRTLRPMCLRGVSLSIGVASLPDREPGRISFDRQIATRGAYRAGRPRLAAVTG